MLTSATVANGSCIWKTMAVGVQPYHITPNTALLISSCDTCSVCPVQSFRQYWELSKGGGLLVTQFWLFARNLIGFSFIFVSSTIDLNFVAFVVCQRDMIGGPQMVFILRNWIQYDILVSNLLGKKVFSWQIDAVSVESRLVTTLNRAEWIAAPGTLSEFWIWSDYLEQNRLASIVFLI